MKNKIISITGELGSGKSVVAKLLARKLSFTFYATGEIQRKLAAQKGMNVLEMNKYAENHREIDDAIDNYTIQLGKTEPNFVIDSRMAWHFIPDAFKVYLFVPPLVAGKRIGKDVKRKSESYETTSEAEKSIEMRRISEWKRFLALYNVDVFHLENYTLVVDTANLTVEEVAECILSQFEKWQTTHFYGLRAYLPKKIATAIEPFFTNHNITSGKTSTSKANERTEQKAEKHEKAVNGKPSPESANIQQHADTVSRRAATLNGHVRRISKAGENRNSGETKRSTTSNGKQQTTKKANAELSSKTASIESSRSFHTKHLLDAYRTLQTQRRNLQRGGDEMAMLEL